MRADLVAAETVDVVSKRRVLAVAAMAFVALVVPAVAAVLVSGRTVEEPDRTAESDSTGTPSTAPSPGPGSNAIDSDDYPRFDDRLLLPMIDIDIEAIIAANAHNDGFAGPPWRPGNARPVEELFYHDDQRRFFDELEACFPDPADSPTPEDIYAAAKDCFDPKAITLVTEAPDPTDVFVAFRALAHARPDTTTACHAAAHRVGEIALRRLYADRGLDRDAMYRFLQLGMRSCLGGLIHGVYDAIGYMKPTLAEFEVAVDVCQQDGSIAGQCSDAVGHASWDATGDIAAAVEVCALWDELFLQATCVEGILMRMYQRLEGEDLWYNGYHFGADADRFIAETARVCDRFPTEPVDGLLVDDPAHLCHQGVVFLLVKPMYALVERDGDNYAAFADEAARLIGVVVEACDTFGPEGSTWCTNHVGTFLPGISWFDEAQVVPMCETLGRNVDKCIADGRERIANTLSGRA